MVPIVKRLNLTNFKILAWNAEKDDCEYYGLDADYIGKIGLNTWGAQNHTIYFYSKRVTVAKCLTQSPLPKLVKHLQPIPALIPLKTIEE